MGSLAAAGGLTADLVTAQQVAEAAKKRLKLAEAALSGEVQRREVAERQLSSAQELLRRCVLLAKPAALQLHLAPRRRGALSCSCLPRAQQV